MAKEQKKVKHMSTRASVESDTNKYVVAKMAALITPLVTEYLFANKVPVRCTKPAKFIVSIKVRMPNPREVSRADVIASGLIPAEVIISAVSCWTPYKRPLMFETEEAIQ